MDEKSFGLLVRVLSGVAIAVTTGFLVSFVVLPAFKADYEPPPEIAVVMSAVITALVTLLGGVYLKSRRARDEDGEDEPGDRDGQ